MTQVVHFLESCPVRTGVGDKFGGYDETTCLVCKSEAILLPKGPDPFRFTFKSEHGRVGFTTAGNVNQMCSGALYRIGD